MDNSTKTRIFYIARILFERTDYEHYLSTQQIMKILEEEYNLPTHRTTVPEDIKLLQELGMDIQCIRGTQSKFALLSRYFDDAELKLLIDAVASSRFISKNESKKLIEKISKLAGNAAGMSLTRNISVERRIKTTNSKSILAMVDRINTAINLCKQIEFQYFEYNEKKKRVLRRGGEKYRFSPYHLVWNGEYYYIVGYYEKYDTITSFRVDRFATQPKILDDAVVPKPKKFDLDHYLNTMSHMYTTERRNVTLVCNNDVMDAIIDRFGEDVETDECDNEHFIANVDVAVNNVFFAWAFGFDGKVMISSPEDVKIAYHKMISSAAEKINNGK